MEDGSQPIQLCLGIGVGNPRETVDAENNFSKASCQAPPFFSPISRLSILLSRIHGQRVVGGERTSAQYVCESRKPPFSLSLFAFFSLHHLYHQIYPLNENIVSREFSFIIEFISFISRVSSLFLFPSFFHFFKMVEQSVYPISTRRYLFERIKLC